MYSIIIMITNTCDYFCDYCDKFVLDYCKLQLPITITPALIKSSNEPEPTFTVVMQIVNHGVGFYSNRAAMFERCK